LLSSIMVVIVENGQEKTASGSEVVEVSTHTITRKKQGTILI